MIRPFLLVCLSAGLAASSAFAAVDPLQKAVDNPDRKPAFMARDAARHPKEVLSFVGLRPNATVVEIWPGGGYWTEILAPYLHADGTYYVALGDKDGTPVEKGFSQLPQALRDKFAAQPEAFGRVRFSQLSTRHHEIAPAGSADLVLTFRNLHNWMDEGTTGTMLAAIHRALKPDGVFGVEDHRARPDRPQDPQAGDGYVRQDYAIAEIERAGFKLVASSEIEANPRDTTHWPKGVWTLPPSYALGEVDRAKYEAIGEGDNFLLTFKKLDR